MALLGSTPALRCSCGGTLLVGKDVQPLQSVKTYSNSRIHGIGRVMVWSQNQCLGLGCFHSVSCSLEKCVAVCLGYYGRGVR
jgi:hypothetical protein